MVEFQTLADLVRRFRELGVSRILCKPLAENDNTKQQIYLGSSFEVLQQLPHGAIRTESKGTRPNFKASLNFYWTDASGHTEQASGAQLILYPDYPEVRLSGFIRGCSLSPSSLMQPVPRGLRKHNNSRDGRLLFLGITADRLIAYAASATSRLARDFSEAERSQNFEVHGVFVEMPVAVERNPRDALFEKLRLILGGGWHESRLLDANWVAIPYSARNGGGYTLEALFGIRPNGNSDPDYMGWEIKGFSQPRITLMTPEPDQGFYGEHGVEAFLRRYGRRRADGVVYFTGTHRANIPCVTTGQTIEVIGFDQEKKKITNVAGSIQLLDAKGHVSAAWSFARLMQHWSRKHAAAAYVPYKKHPSLPLRYRYFNPVRLGEGTDFSKYLAAFNDGHVLYDPAPKLVTEGGRTRVKARSQFRIRLNELRLLYDKFEQVDV